MGSDEPSIATTIRVPERIWRALRALSERRALENGGRPSMSATVAELVERAAEQRPEAPNAH